MQHGHLHQSCVLNLVSGYGRLMLFKCSKLKTLGTSPETCGTTWSNRVFWTLDGECCELQAENFPKILWKFSNQHFMVFSGNFVWGFGEGVLIGKLLAYKWTAYFAFIRQVSWRATCRLSDRPIFHEYWERNGVNMGPESRNIWQSGTKQTISKQKYSEQKHQKPP